MSDGNITKMADLQETKLSSPSISFDTCVPKYICEKQRQNYALLAWHTCYHVMLLDQVSRIMQIWRYALLIWYPLQAQITIFLKYSAQDSTLVVRGAVLRYHFQKVRRQTTLRTFRHRDRLKQRHFSSTQTLHTSTLRTVVRHLSEHALPPGIICF
jgi:hypothetical protein